MPTETGFGAGWLAKPKQTSPIDVAGVGVSEVSETTFATDMPNSVLPVGGFSYVYNGSLLKFYEGVRRDVPPGLKTILISAGLATA